MRALAKRRGGLTHDVIAGTHTIVIDEPAQLGGDDLGPAPTDLLAASLASCAAITMQMYARRKGWDLDEVEVLVFGKTGLRGEPSSFEIVLGLPAELSDDQVQRLQMVADECPVHRALVDEVRFEQRVKRIGPTRAQPKS